MKKYHFLWFILFLFISTVLKTAEYTWQIEIENNIRRELQMRFEYTQNWSHPDPPTYNRNITGTTIRVLTREAGVEEAWSPLRKAKILIIELTDSAGVCYFRLGISDSKLALRDGHRWKGDPTPWPHWSPRGKRWYRSWWKSTIPGGWAMRPPIISYSPHVTKLTMRIRLTRWRSWME